MKPEEFRQKLVEAVVRARTVVEKMRALDSQLPPENPAWMNLKRDVFTKAGDALFADGQYAEAADSYEMALTLTDQAKDLDTWSTLMEMLALSQHGKSDDDEAAETLQRLLAAWTGKEGMNGPNVLRVSTNLANLYFHMEKQTEAITLYTEVQSARTAVYKDFAMKRGERDNATLEAKARLDEITKILEAANPKPLPTRPAAPSGLRLR